VEKEEEVRGGNITCSGGKNLVGKKEAKEFSSRPIPRKVSDKSANGRFLKREATRDSGVHCPISLEPV